MASFAYVRYNPYPDPVYTGIPLGNPANTCNRVHWNITGEKLSWNCPTLECNWRDSNFCGLQRNATGGTVTAPAPRLPHIHTHAHTQTHIVKQSSIRASLKWQDGGTPISKWTDLCKFSFYLEFTVLQWIPILLLKHVSTSKSLLCVCLWYEHHYSFCVFGIANPMKSVNQFSSNNSHHTNCIHRGLHAGKCPDLMTSKRDSFSTLEYHWTDHTGTPLEPQIHWDATGTTLADANNQWCPSGDPVLICIIGTRWKTTGATRTLECHWNHTGWC